MTTVRARKNLSFRRIISSFIILALFLATPPCDVYASALLSSRAWADRGTEPVRAEEPLVILVVDDSLSDLRKNVAALQAEKYTVFSAGTIVEAKAILKEHPEINLIVHDEAMPEGHPEFIYPEMSGKPIIFNTAQFVASSLSREMFSDLEELAAANDVNLILVDEVEKKDGSKPLIQAIEEFRSERLHLQPTADNKTGEQKTLLLVAADDKLRLDSVAWFKQRGYRVAAARSVAQAVIKSARYQPNAVIIRDLWGTEPLDLAAKLKDVPATVERKYRPAGVEIPTNVISDVPQADLETIDAAIRTKLGLPSAQNATNEVEQRTDQGA